MQLIGIISIFAFEKQTKEDKTMTTAELHAERIFRTELLHLGNETKRRLIELLASSLTFPKTKSEDKADKDALFDKICGAWSHDGLTAEEEIDMLRKSRKQDTTRNITDL